MSHTSLHSSGYDIERGAATDMKFVLLHEARNDDGIRSFFVDVWELYVKVGPCVCWACGGLTVGADDAESVPHCAHAHPECGL